MDDRLDIWSHHYYKITKTVLRILGYWPYQSRSELLTCRTVVYFLYFIQFVPQILAVIHYYDDLDLIMEVANSFICDFCVIANMATFHIHLDKIKFLFNQIKEDWKIFPESNGQHVLHESMKLGRKFTLLHSGVLLFAGVIFVTEPVHLRFLHFFIKSNKTLPLRFAIPVHYGPIDAFKYYWTILVISGISILLIVIAVLAADILLFLYAQHACGLFGALGFAIENLPVDEQSSKSDNEYEYNYLKKCIVVHHRAIGFANSVEDIYTWNFFGLMGFNMLGISLTAVQAVTNINALEKLLKTLLFSISETIHLFIQCYMAQSIADSSTRIQQNIMNAKWYHSTRKTKNLMSFMMMRSQVPCELTAGKMMLMSLNTFSSIIRTSATYFTVFLDMR